MNTALKAALIKEFGSQTAAAKALGLSEWRLSRIVRGWDRPREKEIKALAQAIGKKEVAKLIAAK